MQLNHQRTFAWIYLFSSPGLRLISLKRSGEQFESVSWDSAVLQSPCMTVLHHGSMGFQKAWKHEKKKKMFK